MTFPKIGLEDHVGPQQGVGGVDPELAAVTETHFGDLRLGEHHAGITLHLLVEQLRLPRGADILVEDIGDGVGVALPDIQGLLQGGRAAEVGAVREMFRVPGTGALNEGHRFGGFAVGGPHDLARFGHLLHLDIGDHVLGQTVAQLDELGGVVGLPTRRQHHGPHPQGLYVAANRDVGVQQPGWPSSFSRVAAVITLILG